jgi:hypothetical protein
VNAAINNKISLSKILKGKSLYTAPYSIYTVALSELKAILQGSAKKNSPQQATAIPIDDGFREQRRRKRNNSSENETQRESKKPAPHVERQKASKNFFAPQRTEMDAEEKEDDQLSEEQQRPAVAGRPPPSSGRQATTNSTNVDGESNTPTEEIKRLSERELHCALVNAPCVKKCFCP